MPTPRIVWVVITDNATNNPALLDVGQNHMGKCITSGGITFCRLQPGTILRLASRRILILVIRQEGGF